MCVVSAVLDYGYKIYPQPSVLDPKPIDVDTIKEWLKLIPPAKEFDKNTNQPDCHDPKKAEFVQQLGDRLNEIGLQLIKQDAHDDFGVELIQLAKQVEDILK